MTPIRAFSLALAVVLFAAGLAWGVYTALEGTSNLTGLPPLTLAGMAYSYAYFAKWYERWLKE